MNGEMSGHLAECESCRFLTADGAPVARALASASAPPALPDLAGMEAALREDLAAERGLLGRLRSLSQLGRTLVFAAAAGVIGLLYFVYLRRPDWDAHATRLILTAAVYAALALPLAWLALRPLHKEPLSPVVVVAVGLAAPLAYALLPELPSPELPFYRPIPGAWFCFALGATVSALAFLAARAVHRGGSSFALPAAVAAGLVGVLAGHLSCPINYPFHLLFGHATIPFGMVAATLLSRRFAAG